MRISDWSSDVCSSDLTRVGHFYTSRKTASLQADFRLDARNLLSAGADWQRDAVDSDTEIAVTRRDNTGVFAEYQGSFGAHRLHASVRHDDNEPFASHTTGAIGRGLAFADHSRLNPHDAPETGMASCSALVYQYVYHSESA